MCVIRVRVRKRFDGMNSAEICLGVSEVSPELLYRLAGIRAIIPVPTCTQSTGTRNKRCLLFALYQINYPTYLIYPYISQQ